MLFLEPILITNICFAETQSNFRQVWVFDAKLMDTTRPIWFPAQVAVDAQTDFHVMLEGQAANGGFAVDDLMFSPGSCSSEFDSRMCI